MTKQKTKTKVKEEKSLAEKLNEVPTQFSNLEVEVKPNTQANAETTQTDSPNAAGKSW